MFFPSVWFVFLGTVRPCATRADGAGGYYRRDVFFAALPAQATFPGPFLGRFPPGKAPARGAQKAQGKPAPAPRRSSPRPGGHSKLRGPRRSTRRGAADDPGHGPGRRHSKRGPPGIGADQKRQRRRPGRSAPAASYINLFPASASAADPARRGPGRARVYQL